MENKNTDHTPGPWGYTPSPKGGYNIRYGDNVALARVLSTFHPEANARLIAASPELLAALKWAMARIERTTHPAAHLEKAVGYIAARAAIAKAKGE